MDRKRTITTSLLGSYLDGWADLVENIGFKTDEVKNEVARQLDGRNIPGLFLEKVSARPGIFISDQREYLMVETFPGVTTLIFIGMQGKDLYVSWRSYIKPPPNWKLLKVILRIVSIFAILLIIGSILVQQFRSLGEFGTFINNNWASYVGTLWHWLIDAVGTFLFLIISLAVAGLVDHRDPRKYLTEKYFWGAAILTFFLSIFLVNTYCKECTPVIQYSWTSTKELFQVIIASLLSGIMALVIGVCFIILIAMVLGVFIKRNIFYYVTIQPNLFDTENITAIHLAIHKSILRALDLQGIPSDKLRLKQNFKGGRKDEVL